MKRQLQTVSLVPIFLLGFFLMGAFSASPTYAATRTLMDVTAIPQSSGIIVTHGKVVPLNAQQCADLAKAEHIAQVKDCMVHKTIHHLASGSSQVANGDCISGYYLNDQYSKWDAGGLYDEQQATVYYDGSCNVPSEANISDHNCTFNYGATGPGISSSIVNCAVYKDSKNRNPYIEVDMAWSGSIVGWGHQGSVWSRSEFTDGDGDWTDTQAANP